MVACRIACWVAVSGLVAIPLRADELAVRGRVVDENDSPVAAARVTVRPASLPGHAQESYTDLAGAFTLILPGPGDYFFNVERERYYTLKDRPVRVGAAQELTLVINNVREVFQSENVNASTLPVDVSHEQG